MSHLVKYNVKLDLNFMGSYLETIVRVDGGNMYELLLSTILIHAMYVRNDTST